MPAVTSRSLVTGLGFAALLLLLFASPGSRADSSSFNPSFSVTLDTYDEDSPTNVIYSVSLLAPDAMPSDMTSFTPDTWTIAGDAEVPDGALVGMINGNVSLGLIDSACNQELPISFDLWDATTSQATLIGHVAGHQDGNGNGLADAVDFFPSRLTAIFPGVTPYARYYGRSIMAGVPNAVHVLVYAPSQLPGIPSEYFAEVVIIDLWDPASMGPMAITDWCTPLSVRRTMFGVSADNDDTAEDEGGRLLRASGTAGTDVFMYSFKSLGDADGDGIENRLDTCPLDNDIGNPRISYDGDLDGDGLDARCDPNDDPNTGGTNSDEDSDGYLNRQDNCVMVQNSEDLFNQADADGDDIGDVCDISPQQFDGHRHEVTLTDAVVIGGSDTQGDVNCDGEANAIDALLVLRDVAGMSSTTACLLLAGDVNCDGAETAVDALGILRFVSGLPFKQDEPCPNVGAPL